MLKLKVDYNKIYERNVYGGQTLRDIWTTFKVPVKYATFERAVQEYKKEGIMRNMCVSQDYDRLSTDIWEIYDTGVRPRIKRDIKNLAADEIVATIESYEQYKLDLQEYNRLKMTKLEILEGLKKGLELSDICDNEQIAHETLDEISRDGYNVVFDKIIGKYRFTSYVKPAEAVFIPTNSKYIRIGVVSDTHIGSKHSDMSILHELYDTYEELGITDVYHCGDITDGMYPNRSDQVYELDDIGADAQVNRVVEDYPRRDGITTHFITGNHDHTFIRNTGYNVGPAIALRRDDMDYLGHNNAKIYLTPKCVMEVNHPGDGSAYALSYSIQKMCDSYSGGDKPNILLNGHHHKFMQMFYRNIHAFEVPTTQLQTPFMKSKRLAAHVGGLVLDIHVEDDGTIKRIGCELIPKY